MPPLALALVLSDLLPIGITLPVVVVVLLGARMLLRHGEASRGSTVRTQSVMLGLTLAAIIAVVLALPVEQSSKHDILDMLAVLGSAAVALASTTFLSNVLAGLMLRSVRNFRAGDFLRCGENVGRVTQRGLLHVEIQTEDRDLSTLPNLMLIQNPVTVVRSSGTILSTRVSLGYDIPRKEIEAALVDGAARAGLTDPFVQILELGDFAVSYRVAGLLEDVRQLISARARLNAKVLDCLHAAGIEIVSPTFMNTRQVAADARIVPPEDPTLHAPELSTTTIEDLAFDKADLAQSLELLIERHTALEAEREAVAEQERESPEGVERDTVSGRLKSMDTRLEYLDKLIETRKGHLDSEQGSQS